MIAPPLSQGQRLNRFEAHLLCKGAPLEHLLDESGHKGPDALRAQLQVLCEHIVALQFVPEPVGRQQDPDELAPALENGNLGEEVDIVPAEVLDGGPESSNERTASGGGSWGC